MRKIILQLRIINDIENSSQAYFYFVLFLEKCYNYQIRFVNPEMVKEKFDVILIPYTFQFYNQITSEILNNNAQAKYIRYFNEYNMSENSSMIKFFKQHPIYYLIVNHFGYEPIKYYEKKLIFNTNCLAYNDLDVSKDEKKYDIIYYGTFRKDRIKYFKEYFDDNIIISTSKKNIKQFLRFCDFKNLKFIPPILIKNNHNILRKFKYSLYLEDPYTHTHYNFPANRFYEALKFKVVQFFDANCLNTFKTYGIDISDFVVENREQLQKRVKTEDYNKLWDVQKKWIGKVYDDLEELKKQCDEYLKFE